MARYQDPTTGLITEIGSPELNPQLIAGKTLISDTAPVESFMSNGVGGLRTPTISAATITGTQTPINVSTPPAPTPASTEGVQAILDAYNEALAAGIAGTPPPTSSADLYSQLFGQADIAGKQQAVNANTAAVQAAQSKLAGVNARLAGITAEATAISIRAQQEAEGRGITTGGLAPITTGQLRENALKAIPLQTEALIAQAEVAGAQGNAALSQDILNQAQTHLSQVFQIRSQDATNLYNYWKDLRTQAMASATKVEERILAAQQKKDDNAFQLLRDNIKNANDLAIKAIENGQGALAAQISALDPKSATFNSDIAKLQGQIKPKADLQYVAGTANQPSGTFNKTTGVFTPSGTTGAGAGAGAGAGESKQLETVNSINNIINSPAFDSTFGIINMVGRNLPGTASYVLSSEVNNLISNLSLAARGQLKGQGSVSDFEGKTLKDAQTALKMNMTPEQARKELLKVRGAILTSSGQKTQVKLTAKNGQSQSVLSDQNGINQAIKDGLTVEYE
jgi:hypothetical protein